MPMPGPCKRIERDPHFPDMFEWAVADDPAPVKIIIVRYLPSGRWRNPEDDAPPLGGFGITPERASLWASLFLNPDRWYRYR